MLREKQSRFALLVARLILRADELGYQVTLGEAWRPPEMVTLYKVRGTGSAKSLHADRLAIDLNLFRSGLYLPATEDHRELGEWWEKQDPECRWGGRFTRPDGNHYALSHEGRA